MIGSSDLIDRWSSSLDYLFLVNVNGVNFLLIIILFALDKNAKINTCTVIGANKIMDLTAGFSFMNNFEVGRRELFEKVSDDQFRLVSGIVSFIAVDA